VGTGLHLSGDVGIPHRLHFVDLDGDVGSRPLISPKLDVTGRIVTQSLKSTSMVDDVK